MVAGLLGILFTPGTAFAAPTDKDCGDFATQQQAQSYFNSNGGSAAFDFNRLDTNHNGVACETYSYAGSQSTGSGSAAAGGTGNNSQVQQTPIGAVAAGGGGTAGANNEGLLAGGGLMLAGGGVLVTRRRFRRV